MNRRGRGSGRARAGARRDGGGRRRATWLVAAAVGACAGRASPPATERTRATPARAALALAGLDEKMQFSAEHGLLPRGPGADALVVLDLARPELPRVRARLPISNSVFGPPTNLDATPDGRLALIADSMRLQAAPGTPAGWAAVPADRVHVVDLAATPPRALGTVQVGLQPSGLAISPRGDVAVVASRAGRSVALLALEGGARTRQEGAMPVRVLESLAVDGEAADVAFTPDGRRVLVTLFDRGCVQVLRLTGGADRGDVPHLEPAAEVEVGPWPYSVRVSPDGRLALTGDMGVRSGADGQPDTVSVIDLTAEPPARVQALLLGDGPEGLAISPDGRFAVAVLIRGGNAAAHEPYYHRDALAVGLAIEAGRLHRLNEVEVGALGEGVVFGPDARHVYVANYFDRDLSILRFEGEGRRARLVDTGRRVPLPGQPASLQ